MKDLSKYTTMTVAKAFDKFCIDNGADIKDPLHNMYRSMFATAYSICMESDIEPYLNPSIDIEEEPNTCFLALHALGFTARCNQYKVTQNYYLLKEVISPLLTALLDKAECKNFRLGQPA